MAASAASADGEDDLQGLSLEEWKDTDAQSNAVHNSAKGELAIETALELPLSELYLTPAEIQAQTPAVVSLLQNISNASSGAAASASSLPTFPLRIVSEKVRGIAFQLWPAAKVLAAFMMRLQRDVTVAQPDPLPDYRAKKLQAQAAGAGDATATAASSQSLQSVAAPNPLPAVTLGVSSLFWPGQRVLELGAGCGLVGMLAATLGASVTVTDMADVVTHLQANIERNFGDLSVSSSVDAVSSSEDALSGVRRVFHSRCRAAALEWGVQPSAEFAPGSFDVLLLSDW
jgi:ribosomal protein L11 methylase PrmA